MENIEDDATTEAAEESSDGGRKRPYARFVVAGIATFLLLGGLFFFKPFSDEEPEARTSIAVLPLHNLTGDPAQTYFVDGLHDALIGELGQLSGLRVISRTSTLRFRDTQSDIQDIARQLDVDNVIEGSVYKAGDSVRVQIQLIKATPEEQHLWAESYEHDTRNILTM